MKELTIAELRDKYPKLDKWLTECHDEHYEEIQQLKDKVRHFEADLRIEKVIKEALKIELQHDNESFWRRAVSVAEQY